MVDKNWLHENVNDAAKLDKQIESFSMTDGLGDYARRLKRNLMTWTALLFVCVFYNLKITKVPTINVDLPADGRTDALAVIVAVPLIYSLVTFVVHAGADLFHWRTRFEHGLATFTGNAMHRMAAHLHVIEQFLSRSLDDPRVADLQPTVDNAKQAVIATNQQLQKLLSGGRRLTRSRKFFAYVWELGLPVAAALLTMLYARHALIEAIAAVVLSL